jgi:hypothetical protein
MKEEQREVEESAIDDIIFVFSQSSFFTKLDLD